MSSDGGPERPDHTSAGSGSALARACARISESQLFQWTVIVVILANAAILGLETYSGVERDHGTLLDDLDTACLAVFVVEIAIRIAAHGARPDRFFRSGWNVFDFVVVAAVFIPVVNANATLLRLIRVLRVARLLSVIPDLQVILRGLVRSLAPMAGVALLTGVIMYLYAMAGWALFGDRLPARWGTSATRC